MNEMITESKKETETEKTVSKSRYP